MKNVLGLDKLKIITGYPGTRETSSRSSAAR